jgi:adenylate cyclase class IV
MARNIEIKARVPDLATFRAKAASLASGPKQIINQTDTFFVVSRGRLKVRAFSDGSGELISYERADQQGPKESVYTRVACEDARAISHALSGQR